MPGPAVHRGGESGLDGKKQERPLARAFLVTRRAGYFTTGAHDPEAAVIV